VNGRGGDITIAYLPGDARRVIADIANFGQVDPMAQMGKRHPTRKALRWSRDGREPALSHSRLVGRR
jgi:hypothetical protein